MLQTETLASYEAVAVYRKEMEGATNSMNAPSGGRSFTGLDGSVYYSDNEQKSYRLRMASNIQKELKNRRLFKKLDDTLI